MATMIPFVLSNLCAVGSSSFSTIYTIIPAIIPNAIPYARGPNKYWNISQPSNAPEIEK